MTVTLKLDGMECEIVEGSHLTFRRALGGSGSTLAVGGFIDWNDIPEHIMKKVETLQRRANNNAFDLVRTVLMSHTMEFTHPLSCMEVITPPVPVTVG